MPSTDPCCSRTRRCRNTAPSGPRRPVSELSSPFHRRGNWGSERRRDLPQPRREDWLSLLLPESVLPRPEVTAVGALDTHPTRWERQRPFPQRVPTWHLLSASPGGSCRKGLCLLSSPPPRSRTGPGGDGETRLSAESIGCQHQGAAPTRPSLRDPEAGLQTAGCGILAAPCAGKARAGDGIRGFPEAKQVSAGARRLPSAAVTPGPGDSPPLVLVPEQSPGGLGSEPAASALCPQPRGWGRQGARAGRAWVAVPHPRPLP